MGNFARHCLSVAALLVCCRALLAQSGTALLNGDPFGCFTTLDGSPGDASLSTVAVDGQGFSVAWDLRTSNATANAEDVRLRCFDTRPVLKGDIIVATFWMRAITPGQGQAQGNATFVFERGASPYDKDASFTASAGSAWQRFDVAFQASDNYTGASQSSSYNLSFRVGYAGQEVQIGGFSILDYGPDADVDRLNLPPPWPYAGHDPDAPWRRKALDRIERLRKADVAVVLRDSAGTPLAGVPVHLQMKKHAFGWGTAIDTAQLAGNAAYARAIEDNFNKIALEDDLKWTPFESKKINGQPSADYGLNWAKDNGFTMVRGQSTVPPGESGVPADVRKMLTANPVDAAALSKRIDDHFRQVVTSTRGRVTEWNVASEPYSNHDVAAASGESAMAHWFQLAREYDPESKLYLDDACIGGACGADRRHIDFTSNLVKGLVSAGAPLDALGLRSHFDTNLTPPERALDYFDYWATSFKSGLQLQVTEFDVNVPFETVQADYTRDYMLAAFSHPAMTGFMMRGFWEGQHVLPRAAMLRRDWSEKPNYKVWRDLVYKQWWTDVTGATASDGVFHTRAFLGDYDVSYTLNGVTRAVPLTLKSGQLNYATAGSAADAPQFDATTVTNAASHLAGPVAPGEMVTISGTGIGLAEAQESTFDDEGKLPTVLAFTRVLFDGTPASVLAVSQGQVTAIVPAAVQGTTKIVVETLNVQSAAVSVPVATQSPALFTCYGAARTPLMFPQSGPLVLSCDRGAAVAAAGGAVVFFATGLGSGVNQVLFDGKPAPACKAAAISQTSPGVWEVDTCIPAGAAVGTVEVQMQSGASQSASTLVNIRLSPFEKPGRYQP